MDISNKKENQGISVGFILKILRENIIQILILAIVCAGAFGAFKHITTTPTYTSSVTFFVNSVAKTSSSNGAEAVVNPGNTTSARDLAETFGQIIAGGRVLDSAYNLLQGVGTDNINMKDYPELSRDIFEGKYKALTKQDIQQMTRVSVDTQIIKVAITHPDTQMAYAVAQAIEIVTPSSLDYFVGIENTANAEGLESVAKVVNRAEKDLIDSGTGSVPFAIIGFLFGAVVVYLFFFLRAFFDNTVYTEEDLKASFEMSVVGQIPSWNPENSKKKKKKDISHYTSANGVSSSKRNYDGRLLTKDTPFAVAEAFKLLRTNMCYTTKGESCAVYGVTSASMGAGKSVVMTNTAISFGQMGKRVLLIDGDLRCPVLHRIFGLDPKVHGFSELLAGVCTDANEVIRPSNFENVDVITSGRIPPNPAELLASARMREFIATAKTRYDVIFIDLPPICEVTDAGVISDLVTGYVFVVRSGYTDCRLVNIALDLIESQGGAIIGFVLNDVDIKSGDYYKNRYGSYSKYGKYNRYTKYGQQKYGKATEYKYGYSDAELKENDLSRADSKAD